MKLISIHIFTKFSTKPVMLGSAMDLSFAGFFERSTVKEFVNFNSRLVVERTNTEERNEIALERGICYCYVTSENIAISIITDEEYPKRVAFDLIYRIMQEFNEYVFTNKISLSKFTEDTDIDFKYIKTIVAEWQNPRESKI